MEWFRHDVNAHDDLKVKKLLRKSGFSALGVYWFLIELLFSNEGRMACSEAADEVSLIDGLSEEDSMTYIQKLVDLGLLFVDEDGLLGSHRVDSEIGYHENIRRKYSEMGKASAEARRNKSTTEEEPQLDTGSTQVKPTLNTNKHTNIHTKIIPPNNTEVLYPPTGDAPATKSRRFIKPTIQDIEEYGRQTGHIINAQAFIDYYDSVDWKVGKHSMKDWQAAVRNWERRDSSFSNKQEVNKGNSKIDCSGFTEDELAEIKRQEQEALELWRRDHATAN